MRTIAAIPAAGILAGAALGLLFPDLSITIPLLGLAIGLAAAVVAWQRADRRLVAVAVTLAFCAGGAAITVHAWRQASRPPLREMFDAAARAERSRAALTGRPPAGGDGVQMMIAGVLLADAFPAENSVSLSLDVGLPARGGVQLSVAGSLARDRMHEWRAGRTVRVPAQLRRPSRYLNPGVPDQERTLARRGTALVGSVKSGALVEIVAYGGVVSEWAAAARAHVRRVVRMAVGKWSSRSAGIVTAIIIGDRAGLDEEVRRRLQEAGTYHVIAISGGNIAILAGLALALFRLAGLFGRTAMLTAIVALTAYAYLVGGGASVDRATLMAVVYFAGRAVDLRGSPLNALALVAAILVTTDPLSIADPAFLLTLGATAGILLVVPLTAVGSGFSQVAPFVKRAAAAAIAMLTASIAAEAVLLPVSAYFFSRITIAGLLLNFAAIPLMAVTQVAGMAVVPIAAVSADAAAAAGWVAHAGAEGLVRSAGLVELIPAVTWRVPAPRPAIIALYYIGLAVAWAMWRRSVPSAPNCRYARGAASVVVIAALWSIAAPWTFPGGGTGPAAGNLRITFVDVGQGDAVHVRFPGGRSLLVDAGGLPGASSFDIGDRVVGATLRHDGVWRLDVMAITHGDADHVGGARSIVRDFRPRDVWEGVPVPPFEPLRALRDAAEAIGARWVTLQAHDAMTIDGVQLLVRHPPVPDWERQQVRNDDSLVLELVWRDVSVVLTGDIGRDVERGLAPLFAPAPLRVVKLPHHGSATSSSPEFVEALKPRIAVVSAGRGNPFGHPAAAVLERYYRAGAEVFRTDREGAITIDTDGYALNVRTYTGRTLTVP